MPIRLLVLPLALLLAAAAALPARADDFKPGRDYILLEEAQPTRVPLGKIEVVEFFNFSCPHCFRLQSHFAKWKAGENPDDVVVARQPVVFSQFRGHFARMYYTLEAMGIADEYTAKVYDTIHVQRRLLNSRGRFLDWLEDEGQDADKAGAVYDSFSVNSLTNRAVVLAADYGVRSTPHIAVGGKYLLNAAISGSYERMMETLSALVERERTAAQ